MLRGQRGVTLLELMVAVAITALLSVALYKVFKTNIDSWQRGEARTQKYQNARIALDRMSKEIRSAISLTKQNSTGGAAADNTESFIGTDGTDAEGDAADTLDFLTASNPPTVKVWGSTYTPSEQLIFDIIEIGYYVSGTSLIRRKAETNKPDGDVNNPSDGEKNEMAHHVTGLNFRYWDGATWQTSWTASPNTLPKQVEITLTVQAETAPAGIAKKKEDISTKVYIPLGN